MKRQVGPLKMYQWVALGVIAGLGVLVWRRSHPSSSPEGEVFGGTGTGAFGPINPETGVPYAFEGQGGASPGDALGGLGELIEQLRELGIIPERGEAGEDEKTPTEAAEDAGGAGAKAPRKHAKQGKGQAQGKRRPRCHHSPATSTGAGAAAGGHRHTAAPHPKHRIGVGPGHPAKQHGGHGKHAVGATPSHRQPHAPRAPGKQRAGVAPAKPARKPARPVRRPAPKPARRRRR